MTDYLYENWINIWEEFLGVVEPHLPEHLHWNELCWTFVFYLNEVRLFIHHKTNGLENWEIVVNTITYCFFVFLFLEVLLRKVVPFIFFNDEGFFNVIKQKIFWLARRLPVIGTKIQAEIDKSIAELEATAFKVNGQPYVKKLLWNGMKSNELMKLVQRYQEIDDKSVVDDGYVSGAVYAQDNELSELMVQMYKNYSWANPLHADVFPDVRKMEAEVVSMCVNMFNGDENCCGTMTSGGTESILMACKCYRELGRARGIQVPEIIAPYSVHPAFDKACHYFNMKLTHIPVDKKTGRADVKAMKRAISRRTILLVGSVPGFPHGCIDPIEDLSKLAKRYNLYFHADCCLGGFLVAFMKKAGFHVPPYDFTLPGVTSISADTHKYGFAPKGSSVVLFRSKEIRKQQYFAQPNWSGGVYASATIPGSRPGNVIACTWASMMYHGEKGYVESTKLIVNTARYIASKLEKIPGIRIMSPVDVSVVAFTSDVFDIYLMSDELAKMKWHLNPLQFPSGLHIAVTVPHTKKGVADRFITDISKVAANLMKNPTQTAQGKGAIYGLSQQIPDRTIISDITTAFLDTYYSCTAGLKEEQK
ncbi:sphingosine-1-phosphate lyase 1-like [Hydractinia symbiolongicarpus]|uniref:sphingosine-1-phosphate lyase 1-like n=1 Tax=Hydractinia symbiolongicarpus TaxID=13093 RepID=UPI0025511A34|nr:sphingosine-1-phosphate lyase 1-like [Hydractinia symbiolongicarpus]